MRPLTVLSMPPKGTGKYPGRPRIVGTILQGTELMAVVRRVYSLGDNAGNTGSPPVECWVALCESSMRPLIVRRVAEAWSEADRLDIGPIWMPDAVKALALCGYQLTDVWPGNASPEWPTSIWDRRIILPDDDRFPSLKKPTVGAAIRKMLAERNDCPDDTGWAIDAQIIGLAPKAKKP